MSIIPVWKSRAEFARPGIVITDGGGLASGEPREEVFAVAGGHGLHVLAVGLAEARHRDGGGAARILEDADLAIENRDQAAANLEAAGVIDPQTGQTQLLVWFVLLLAGLGVGAAIFLGMRRFRRAPPSGDPD